MLDETKGLAEVANGVSGSERARGPARRTQQAVHRLGPLLAGSIVARERPDMGLDVGGVRRLNRSRHPPVEIRPSWRQESGVRGLTDLIVGEVQLLAQHVQDPPA